MPCTREQQEKVTPALIDALAQYQDMCSWEGDKTGNQWLSKFSPIRFNKYEVGTMMRRHYDHIHSIFDGKRKILRKTIFDECCTYLYCTKAEGLSGSVYLI